MAIEWRIVYIGEIPHFKNTLKMSTQIKIKHEPKDAAGLQERLGYAQKILLDMSYQAESGNSFTAKVHPGSFISLMGMLQTYCNKAKTSVEVENNQGQKLSFSAVGKFNFRELENKVMPLLS
jgi:hypothetical protein